MAPWSTTFQVKFISLTSKSLQAFNAVNSFNRQFFLNSDLFYWCFFFPFSSYCSSPRHRRCHLSDHQSWCDPISLSYCRSVWSAPFYHRNSMTSQVHPFHWLMASFRLPPSLPKKWELMHFVTNLYYNITKAKRALWLANSASTICPWVYAADVLNN